MRVNDRLIAKYYLQFVGVSVPQAVHIESYLPIHPQTVIVVFKLIVTIIVYCHMVYLSTTDLPAAIYRSARFVYQNNEVVYVLG